MTSTNDLMTDAGMISVGAVPIHPGVQDYADTGGKVILFVREEAEGRSLFLSIEMYGEISRMYEVRYADWEGVVTKMTGDLMVHDLMQYHDKEAN
jgi:hypothetical protein